MPQRQFQRPCPAQCRECMRRRSCVSVSKQQGGNYRTAPWMGYGMLCVECLLDMLPYVLRHGTNGYQGAGRWSSFDLRLTAKDLFVPVAPWEANAARSASFR